MCYTVQTRISATIIIRFLVPARNDEVEATVTTLSYNSYVLYLRIHAPTKNYTRPTIRHPWQGPGTSSSCAVQCRLEQAQTIIIRFPVQAGNDGIAPTVFLLPNANLTKTKIPQVQRIPYKFRCTRGIICR